MPWHIGFAALLSLVAGNRNRLVPCVFAEPVDRFGLVLSVCRHHEPPSEDDATPLTLLSGAAGRTDYTRTTDTPNGLSATGRARVGPESLSFWAWRSGLVLRPRPGIRDRPTPAV